MEKVGLRLSEKQIDSLSRELVLDLIAVFNLLQDDIKDMLKMAEEEEWTPERLIEEIEKFI